MREDLPLQGTAVILDEIVIVRNTLEEGVEVPIALLTRNGKSCKFGGS